MTPLPPLPPKAIATLCDEPTELPCVALLN